MTPDLQATLRKLPDRPGVYLMRDARGEVVYVGKAQSLRNRVRSYWQKATPVGEIHRIRSVIDRVHDVEYTLTDSVSEALLLEANLIKRFRPRFNIRLKDDKSYPYIKITKADDFPRVERTRKLVEDGSRYFGPYASASSVDESMNLVRRLFPFRTCTIEIREGERALARPCLLYHIKRCQGPCIEAVSKAEYGAQISQIELFLEGRQESVVQALTAEMRAASERTDYERAAGLRDKIRAIERTMESQKMAAFARTELDLVGLARQDNQAAVTLFIIRDGKMIGRDVYLLDAARPGLELHRTGGLWVIPLDTMKSARDAGQLVTQATNQNPVCVLIDLQNPGLEIQSLVPDLKECGNPYLVAYGSHVDAATLKKARDAGCDIVLPRSKFVELLPNDLKDWLSRSGPATC